MSDTLTINVNGETLPAPDVSTFAVTDRDAACTAILAAVPWIKGTAESFAFGKRSDYFKRWAYHFKDMSKPSKERIGAWTKETDPTTRAPYKTMRAWARMVFAPAIAQYERDHPGSDGVKSVTNAIDNAATEGVRLIETDKEQEPKKTKNALEMLQQAFGLYMHKALSIDLTACEALLVTFQQAYNAAVDRAEQQQAAAQQQQAAA